MSTAPKANELKSRIRIWDFKASPVEDFDVLIDGGGWEVIFFAHNYLCRHIITDERAEEGTLIRLKCIGKGLAAELADRACTACGEPCDCSGECDGCADDRIQEEIENDDRPCETCGDQGFDDCRDCPECGA